MPHLDVPLDDIEATRELAEHLAPYLCKGDVLALSGDLGAGKTEFARALLRVLGVTGDVPSPTFTLLQTYDAGGLSIAHFDLYRLKSADELDELGWDDALADGVALVEWPVRAEGRLPESRLEFTFELEEDGTRNVVIEPFGNWLDRF